MVLLLLRAGAQMAVVQSKMLVLQAFSASIILMIALLVDVAVRILSYSFCCLQEMHPLFVVYAMAAVMASFGNHPSPFWEILPTWL